MTTVQRSQQSQICGNFRFPREPITVAKRVTAILWYCIHWVTFSDICQLLRKLAVMQTACYICKQCLQFLSRTLVIWLCLVSDESPTANVVVANYPTTHLNSNLRCTVTLETVWRKGILSNGWNDYILVEHLCHTNGGNCKLK